MASKDKVVVIAEDKSGKVVASFGTKTLTSLFSKLPVGTELVFKIDEGKDFAPQVVGDYLTRSMPEGTTPTPTPDNKAPVVNAGEDVTVNSGDKVTLDGSAVDLDGTIDRVEWHQMVTGVPMVDLIADSSDATNVSFTAPAIPQGQTGLVLEFILEAFDNKGASNVDKIKVTVGQVNGGGGGTEPPKGVLWTSKSWGNNHARIIKGVATDPDDNQYEMRAGADVQGKKELEIDGKGTAKQTGERYRQYIWNEPGHTGSQGGAE